MDYAGSKYCCQPEQLGLIDFKIVLMISFSAFLWSLFIVIAARYGGPCYKGGSFGVFIELPSVLLRKDKPY